jgi:hypothetical protein
MPTACQQPRRLPTHGYRGLRPFGRRSRRPLGSHRPATYTFRVRILGGFYAPPGARRIWRELELTADQTLADLGDAIPLAFGSPTRSSCSCSTTATSGTSASSSSAPASQPGQAQPTHPPTAANRQPG